MIYYEHKAIIFKNGKWIDRPDRYELPFEYSESGIIHTIGKHRPYFTWVSPYGHHIGQYHDKNVDVYICRCLTGRLNVSFYMDKENTYIVYGWGDVCYFNPFTFTLGETAENIFVEHLYEWCCENALTWIGDVLYQDDIQENRIRKTKELQRRFLDEERYKDIGECRMRECKVKEDV